MSYGLCCVTEPRSRTALQLDIFIEIPDQRADEQEGHQTLGVCPFSAADQFDTSPNKGDGHGVDGGERQPHQLPHKVALGEKVIALYVAPDGDYLDQPSGLEHVMHPDLLPRWPLRRSSQWRP